VGNEQKATESFDTLPCIRHHAVTALIRGGVLIASVALSACAVIPGTSSPKALDDFTKQNQKDRETIQKDVATLQEPLTMEAALARALKYNLDLRARQMEEVLASSTYRGSNSGLNSSSALCRTCIVGAIIQHIDRRAGYHRI
jgi:hypothetical protein